MDVGKGGAPGLIGAKLGADGVQGRGLGCVNRVKIWGPGFYGVFSASVS